MGETAGKTDEDDAGIELVLDDTDRRIFAFWLKNSGATKTVIARKLKLSRTTVWARMKRGTPLRNAIDATMESIIEDAADRLVRATGDAAAAAHEIVRNKSLGAGERLRAAELIFDQVSPSKNAPPVPENWVVWIGEGGVVKKRKVGATDVGTLPAGNITEDDRDEAFDVAPLTGTEEASDAGEDQ